MTPDTRDRTQESSSMKKGLMLVIWAIIGVGLGAFTGVRTNGAILGVAGWAVWCGLAFPLMWLSGQYDSKQSRIGRILWIVSFPMACFWFGVGLARFAGLPKIASSIGLNVGVASWGGLLASAGLLRAIADALPTRSTSQRLLTMAAFTIVSTAFVGVASILYLKIRNIAGLTPFLVVGAAGGALLGWMKPEGF